MRQNDFPGPIRSAVSFYFHTVLDPILPLPLFRCDCPASPSLLRSTVETECVITGNIGRFFSLAISSSTLMYFESHASVLRITTTAALCSFLFLMDCRQCSPVTILSLKNHPLFLAA